MAAPGPNAEQIEYWNERAGPRWVAADTRLDELIGPLGALALERSRPARGEAVLDVGCGCGHTARQLAERVAPTGSVTGIDVSRVMLDQARRRGAGVGNLEFVAADAQTAVLPKGRFDLLFSRFGVMFFDDPVAAFTNLHGSLAPGGRLAFACWQELARNEWMQLPLAAAAGVVALPPPPEPGAPGPFAFADSARVRDILESAGFHGVACEPAEQPLRLGAGPDPEPAVAFLLEVGPLSRVVQELPPEERVAVAGTVREALLPFSGPEGVRMGAAAWIVTASA